MSVNRIFYFNNYDLSALINIQSIEFSPIAKKLNEYERVASDGMTQTTERYISRKIIVSGYIAKSSRNLLLATFDTLNSKLVGVDKEIACDYNNAMRKFYGTNTSITTNEIMGGFGKVTLVFSLSDPFGYGVTDITASKTANTAATYNLSVINGGSYPAEPIITIFLDDITTTDDANTITLTVDSVTLTIARTFADDETIIVDCTTKTTTVDGTAVEVQGRYPEIPVGTYNITYTDDFSSARDVDISASFKQRY